MISIIIPYYNPSGEEQLEKMLRRAISSAVSQARPNSDDIEVIVVDDGSPRPPREAVSAFNSYPVRLIEAEHGRLGAARNRGIEAAGGEIIAFLDADDYYFNDTLMPCAEAMRAADADLLQFRFAMLYESAGSDISHSSEQCAEATPTGGHKPPQLSEPVPGREYMVHHTPFGSSCMYLIRRSLIEDNNLRFAENTYMEDEDFTPRLLFFSRRFVTSDATVYAYCRHEGSITTAPMYDERAENTLNVIRRLIAFRDSQNVGQRDGLDRKIRFLAMDHIRRTLRRPDWKRSLNTQTEALREMDLWPLANAAYGIRYRLFTALAGSRFGIRLLHLNEKRYRL